MGKKGQAPIKVVRVVLCGGLMPKQSVEYSAGYDLYVPFDTVIKRGRQVVKIGVKIGLPPGIDDLLLGIRTGKVNPELCCLCNLEVEV